MKAMMILWVNGHHGHLANSSKRIVFRGHEVEEVEIRISKKMYKVDIVGAQIWLNCQDQGKNKINLKIITKPKITENRILDLGNHKVCF